MEHGEHSCPKCWADTSTPLFCETCEELLEPREGLSPFDALGVEPSYLLDKMALRKRLLALSRRVHPDFHGTSDPSARELAERNTAELNAAFEVLSDDFRRADWLVRSLGGPDERQERQMPQEFLMEVMEWNEAVEEARNAGPGSKEHAALEELAELLQDRRRSQLAAVAESLSPPPEPRSPKLLEVRQRLNAVRYLNRALREIAELRLAQASST